MSEMSNPPPLEVWHPSELVGRNVKRLRTRRGWSQQRLVDRLDELLTESPPWAEDLYEARQNDPTRPTDSRERRPPRKRPGSKWTQAKIARLESGKLQKVRIEEAFELALALDCSPIFLMTHGVGEGGEPLRIRLAPTMARWPGDVRLWLHGAKPLLSAGDYRTDAEAVAGYRSYVQTQSRWELREATKKADELRRAWRPVEDLLASSDEIVDDG